MMFGMYQTAQDQSMENIYVGIKNVTNSGSSYFNYKGYFSIILMAVSDADGLFTTIYVSELGCYSDGGVVQNFTNWKMA